jgi:hypothetical protein
MSKRVEPAGDLDVKRSNPTAAHDEALYLDPLGIDLTRLFWEWWRQPKLMEYWCEKQAKAKKGLDDAERDLELVEARLQLEVRRSPEDYGIDKATDKSVEAGVIRHPKYQEARDKINVWKYRVASVGGTVRSLEHKKSGLSDLLTMRLNDMWKEPRTPDMTEDERAQVDRMAKQEVRSRGQKPRRVT